MSKGIKETLGRGSEALKAKRKPRERGIFSSIKRITGYTAASVAAIGAFFNPNFDSIQDANAEETSTPQVETENIPPYYYQLWHEIPELDVGENEIINDFKINQVGNKIFALINVSTAAGYKNYKSEYNHQTRSWGQKEEIPMFGEVLNRTFYSFNKTGIQECGFDESTLTIQEPCEFTPIPNNYFYSTFYQDADSPPDIVYPNVIYGAREEYFANPIYRIVNGEPSIIDETLNRSGPDGYNGIYGLQMF